MDNYFIDREELVRFVDQLVTQKPIDAADQNAKEVAREQLISDLDRSIRLSILNQLSDEQLDELNGLLDRDEANEDVEDEYEKFFQNSGVNVSETVTNTATAFARAYLGGNNG